MKHQLPHNRMPDCMAGRIHRRRVASKCGNTSYQEYPNVHVQKIFHISAIFCIVYIIIYVEPLLLLAEAGAVECLFRVMDVRI